MGTVTVINPYIQNKDKKVIQKGTILCEKFVVKESLSTDTGEADLYTCSHGDKEFVAKIYRRETAMKPEVAEILQSIHSPYVAGLCAYGEFGDRTVEILPLYRKGSFKNCKLEYEKLRSVVIPCVNEGLKVLHDHGIIHKDLKPSNIVQTENGQGAAIIDFGISSITDERNTIVVTQTGMTPEYAAPETYKNLFLKESDYYSFGITLYELYCGKTPYKDIPSEEIERYIFVQNIPFPKDMPEELKNLITGLTYHDISKRREKTNPNRRWGYEEVKKWLEGIPQIIPGTAIEAREIKPYVFLGKSFTERSELVSALVKNWEEGKKELFQGNLSSFFSECDKNAEILCRNAEQEAAKKSGKDDLIFCRLMYQLNKKSGEFLWKGYIYGGLPALGRELLDSLWKNNHETKRYMDEVLTEGILSFYMEFFDGKNEKGMKAAKSLEANYRAYKNTKDRERCLYLIGYMLSGQKILRIEDKEFKTIGEMAAYMKNLSGKSFDKFTEFCYRLLDSDGKLEPQFESWLTAWGKGNEIKKWQEHMQLCTQE